MMVCFQPVPVCFENGVAQRSKIAAVTRIVSGDTGSNLQQMNAAADRITRKEFN